MTKFKKKIWLIGGEDCSLCDVASNLLDIAMANEPEFHIEISYINVKSTTLLYHNYGARIPVLLNRDTDMALYWPFELPQVQEFLRA
ncbi:glutaredoxin family protein [Glaciecola sp. HTCC2999]|uniref:glutaredoxin family protein n=1 Tax=Glaciecola sp. HTCC2999 TaxID=455436 RepID=UPI0000E10B9C|nr:glutaredoxin family protein [Glaciecola sp. HTCC2999]